MSTQSLPILQDDYRVAQGRISAPDEGRQVYIETYGCQMNVADTELVASILSDAGFGIVETPDKANIILINTCAVRENAESRVIGRASQLNGLRQHTPNLTIGILGCMAQHLAKELPQRAPFVDLVMGPDAYRRLPQILTDTSEDTLLDLRLSRDENYVGLNPVRKVGTNAWVTIIRGCDKFCTFCIVPYVRGRERSVAAEEVLRQVRNIAAEGFKEVTLLGQTVNSYNDGQTDFAQLLYAVAQINGIERIRFTSPYPKDFHPSTIEAIAALDKVCPSVHLPVQSGSDRQLDLMRRGYTIGQYRDLVRRLRDAIPDLTLTTDIITGFCGETEEDFQHTYDLMEEIRYDSAFMFKYSQREGTHAAKKMVDDVPEEIKGERLQRIIALQEQICAEKNQPMIGQTVQVLVEGPSKRQKKNGPTLFGRSPQGKVVVFPQQAETNTLVQVHIDRVSPHTLFGNRVEASPVLEVGS
jgi:tRNA-2-methylthio-N6-dimethylallyladenosine synthase